MSPKAELPGDDGEDDPPVRQHHADARQKQLGPRGDGLSSGHPQPVALGQLSEGIAAHYSRPFLFTISHDIAASIHVRSFPLEKVAAASMASSAGCVWYIIFLLGGQPGRMLQRSITSPFQLIILMGIFPPAPHHPGLCRHPGLQPASTGRPSLALQGVWERAVPPKHLSPRTNCAKNSGWSEPGTRAGPLGPNMALSSTSPTMPCFVQQRKGWEKKPSLPF